MDYIKNCMQRTTGLVCLQRHTKFSNTFRPIRGGEFLKHILPYSYCTKNNEVPICHSGIKSHVSYIGDFCNIIWLCSETFGSVLSIVFNCLFRL